MMQVVTRLQCMQWPCAYMYALRASCSAAPPVQTMLYYYLVVVLNLQTLGLTTKGVPYQRLHTKLEKLRTVLAVGLTKFSLLFEYFHRSDCTIRLLYSSTMCLDVYYFVPDGSSSEEITESITKMGRDYFELSQTNPQLLNMMKHRQQSRFSELNNEVMINGT